MTRKPYPDKMSVLQQDPDATPEAVARALGFRPAKPQTRIVRESPPAEYEAAAEEESPSAPAES